MENKAVNLLRVLSAETITNANSGHSGIALGAAPLLYATYKSMRVDPARPDWDGRDRFVMSAGHGSALLYATLHLFGFPVSTDDLKTFRKLGSKLHGHPELDESIGVDASTGPLGQGVAMAVGLAAAEKRLESMAKASQTKSEGMFGWYTFVLAGDGCLMEGISYEAANLAGLWGLDKLIMLYDSNRVTLDGTRESADGEDVVMRFRACGWNVISVGNANEAGPVIAAIEQAKQSRGKPTIIVCNTIIGLGSKNQGTNKAHGEVLTVEQITELRKQWGIEGGMFEIPADVKKHFEAIIAQKKGLSKGWKKEKKGKLNLEIVAEGKAMALRDAGHVMLNQVAKQNPKLIGGSADLASTTKAFIAGGVPLFVGDRDGTGKGGLPGDIAFGVREHAMGAMCNGLALGGFDVYCSTFLAFSDYLRPAIRMTALMNLPVHYIFTHDGLGNPPDGPTHQGAEHISALRLIPNMSVFRPCDDVEVAGVFKYVHENRVPACTILSRGGGYSRGAAAGAEDADGTRLVCGTRKSEEIGRLAVAQTVLDFASVSSVSSAPAATEKRTWVNRGDMLGGYAIWGSYADAPPAVTLLATGTEVALAVEACEELKKQGIRSKVVSMPCTQIFDRQDAGANRELLGHYDGKKIHDLPIVAIEMGVGDIWYKYVGQNGRKGAVISFDTFGSSGGEVELRHKLGFTVENVVKVVKEILS